jgi:hypothetical protein
MSMNVRQRGLQVRDQKIGLSLGALLLSALVVVGTAATQNTAYGTGALQNNTGYGDSAFGFDALFSNTTGDGNTATGDFAPEKNTTGIYNTAIGYETLFSNTTGSAETATVGALCSNATGYGNSTFGFSALSNDTRAAATPPADGMSSPTTSGITIPPADITPSCTTPPATNNTATGLNALQANTTGANDTADGATALQSNTTGYGNVASSVRALFLNTTGFRNTAAGDSALYHNTAGHSNTALGFQAGYNINRGSNNIEIGSLGAAADANTIRIGTQGIQKATYIADISGMAMTGADCGCEQQRSLGRAPVLGPIQARHSTAGHRSRGLWHLRPVTVSSQTRPARPTAVWADRRTGGQGLPREAGGARSNVTLSRLRRLRERCSWSITGE